MEAINETRLKVWARQPEAFRAETARIDADGTIVPTTGECKEGMDIAYNGQWGYSALVVSLANTGEPLYLKNRPGNRPSHEGVIGLFDQAIALCRRAGSPMCCCAGTPTFRSLQSSTAGMLMECD